MIPEPIKLSYRKDIDGLRAVSVLAVILYHMGYLKFGYLGVDVFFVISGFLITNILYTSLENQSPSILNFYNRRIRRIVPLVLVINLVALILGLLLMLPYDLDKLVQSIIATNFFGNNILELFTTNDYWQVANEYSPLMHTWSLGIEEQFYLFYPFIFLLFKGRFSKLLLPFLVVATLISLTLFFIGHDTSQKFYLLHFRFFELSLGGILSIMLMKFKIPKAWTILLVLAFIISVVLSVFANQESFLIISVVILTLALLHINSNGTVQFLKPLLENKMMVLIGKMSFSLYMWHQLLLAFIRYGYIDQLLWWHCVIIGFIIFALSFLTYQWVEGPFRDINKVNNRKFYSIIGITFLLINLAAGYIYLQGGVIKDIPELGIKKGDAYRNMHLDYNTRHIALKSDFKNNSKVKVFVIGNSFSRDWINVMMASTSAEKFDYFYQSSFPKQQASIKRMQNADVIFIGSINKNEIDAFANEHHIDLKKIFYIGLKNYGINNGLIYNTKHDANYCIQKLALSSTIINKYKKEKKLWGSRYIDLIGMVKDQDNRIPVFTPDCKFISQDCKHFTPAGAQYYANLIDSEKYDFTFNNLMKNKSQ